MNLRVLQLAFSSHTDFVGRVTKSLIEYRWNEGGRTFSDRSSIAYTPPSAQLKRGVAGQKWLWVALMVIVVFIRQQGQSPVLVQVYVILGDSKLVTWPNTSVTGSVPAHLAGFCNRAKYSTQRNPSTVESRCQEEAEWGHQCIFTLLKRFPSTRVTTLPTCGYTFTFLVR